MGRIIQIGIAVLIVLLAIPAIINFRHMRSSRRPPRK